MRKNCPGLAVSLDREPQDCLLDNILVSSLDFNFGDLAKFALLAESKSGQSLLKPHKK